MDKTKLPDMTPEYKRIYDNIIKAFDNNKKVLIQTYTKANIYTSKWRDKFSFDSVGIYVMHGKRKDAVNWAKISIER